MSVRRLAGLGSLLAFLLMTPTSASAASSLAITGARLGPEGASVTVTAQYSCDEPFSSYLGVEVTQANGNKLVRAGGYVSTYDGGLVCDGATHTAQIVAVNSGTVPFKKGKATVGATLQQQYYPNISVTREVSLR